MATKKTAAVKTTIAAPAPKENIIAGSGLDMMDLNAPIETMQPGDAPPVNYVPLDDVLTKEVTLEVYAVNLFYNGCKSENDADKMLAFVNNEEDLNKFLAMCVGKIGYSHAVIEAVHSENEKDIHPFKGAAEFMVPRIYFDPNSPFNNTSVDTNIQAIVLWWNMFFGCDSDAEYRKLVEESK